MKHLQFYLDNAGTPETIAKYQRFIGDQESAVVHYGTNANADVGSVWYAPSGAKVSRVCNYLS
jgi:hypothetical protein